MFDPVQIGQFYDTYGLKEWQRLDSSAYGKLIFALHTDFLDGYLKPGMKVLDAGCAAGRFSIYAAQKGCRVTLLDLSPVQLEIARTKCEEAGILDQIDGFIPASYDNLSMFADDSFDLTLCLGSLMYLREQTKQAISELRRVTRSGGSIVFSVNTRSGVFRRLTAKASINNTESMVSFWANPEAYGIFEVLETGDDPVDYPGRRHPPRHYFTVQEMKDLLSPGFEKLDFAAVPCIMTGAVENAEMLYADPKAWNTILRIERSLYRSDTVLDAGEFLMVGGVKKKRN